jgi:adenine-specific DNA-methyltransferase
MNSDTNTGVEASQWQRIEGNSIDLVEEGVMKLRELFPEAFRESGEVDLETLKQLLGVPLDKTEEKYGMYWSGKRQARQAALTPSSATLRPCPNESVNWESTGNLFIEGDNLEVLKLLQKSYSGKVSLIFIDPPYNTGGDFVYNDKYQDSIRNYLEITGQVETNVRISSNAESSGRFHTQWLNMIYPRLKLARNLMHSQGFVFVTIDDGEVHNLRCVMNEIFGEENFIANVIWQKKYTRANDAQFFSDNHDHVLVFAKDKGACNLQLQPRNEEQTSAYSNPDGHLKGPWKATPLHAKSGSNTGVFTFSNGVSWSPPAGTFRRFSDETMRELDAGGEIWFGAEGTSTPSRKSFLSDVKSGVTPVTIWPYDEVGHNHEANTEVKELLGQGVFDNPKPTRLLQRIIQLAGSQTEESVVLDFFAGSGTTGHAVMLQNLQDSARRRFILVQLPEQLESNNKRQTAAIQLCESLGKPRNIAEITKHRLREAGKKIGKESVLFEMDLGFRVFKLATSNLREWDTNSRDLESALFDSVNHLKEDRSSSDVLFELLLKLGLDLCVPIEQKLIAGKTIYSIGFGALIACLDLALGHQEVEQIALGIVAWLEELAPTGEPTLVFRDSAFADDVTKTNLTAILHQHGLENVRSL